MRILGIDPGLRTTGFGVVEKHGNQLHYVASGTIRTNKEEQGNLPERLKVPPAGLEPALSASVARRFFPLSYGGVRRRAWESNPTFPA